jgi:hypothetical protein
LMTYRHPGEDESSSDPPPGGWTIAILVLAFGIGAWVGRWLIVDAPAAAQFTGASRADLLLWAGLIGAFCGWALAMGIVTFTWLTRILVLFEPRPTNRRERIGLAPVGWPRIFGWLVLAALVFGVADMVGGYFPAATLHGKAFRPLSSQIMWITVIGVGSALPGLIGMLALRKYATDDYQWSGDPRAQVFTILQLRNYLRRLLAALGILLTLLVVATAARRQSVLSLRPAADFPTELVLLYGLMFAGILALFHLPTLAAIDGRCERIMAVHAPIPSPSEPDISTPLQRRHDLSVLLGQGDSWRASFESGVVIFAPLLTALLGVAVSTKP